MKDHLTEYYLSLPEPTKSCLLALRQIILDYDSDIVENWRYAMPFFYYRNKMLCYIRVFSKTGVPYIGFVDGGKIDHPKLIADKRSRMKVMELDPTKDIPIKTLKAILKLSLRLRVKIK